MSAAMLLGATGPTIGLSTGASVTLPAAVGASTTGLFGTAGAFSAAQTLSTLGTAAKFLSPIGALVSGFGEAAAEERDARLAEQQAAFDAAQKRKETQRLLARQRAGFGASGVQVQTGTPLVVAEETAGEGELDALQTLYGGKAEATIRRSSASQKRTGSVFGAGTSLLAGLA